MKFWDYKKDRNVSGIYRGWIPSFGKFKSRAYVLQVGARDVGVWSNQSLTEELYAIPFGTKLKIIYRGKVQATGDQYARNIFKVEVLEEDEGAADMTEETGRGPVSIGLAPTKGRKKSPKSRKPKKGKKVPGPKGEIPDLPGNAPADFSL